MMQSHKKQEMLLKPQAAVQTEQTEQNVIYLHKDPQHILS